MKITNQEVDEMVAVIKKMNPGLREDTARNAVTKFFDEVAQTPPPVDPVLEENERNIQEFRELTDRILTTWERENQ